MRKTTFDKKIRMTFQIESQYKRKCRLHDYFWHDKTLKNFQVQLMLNRFISLGVFHEILDFRLLLDQIHWK